MSYLVYIMECSDNTLYIGSTNNLEKRLHEHNNLKSGAHYTKIRRPVKCVYTEDCEDLSTARKREFAIKKLTRKDKLLLITSKAA
jgi:putative endonuclease